MRDRQATTGWRSAAAWLVLAGAAAAGGAQAEEAERKLGWARKVELNLVSTRGNAVTDTFGVSAAFVRTLERATLTLSGRGLRASSGATSRRAVGPSPSDFMLLEASSSVVTAEQYSVDGRYEQRLSQLSFWHASLGWDRNEPAGLRDRVSAVGGIGHVWRESQESRFRTDYGVTYTSQDDLVPAPGLDATYFGLRLSYDYWRRATASTKLGSTLVVDHNLDERRDLRADLVNRLSVAISGKLALEVSLQVLHDRLPALGLLPLEFPAGTATGDTVLFELDDTDTILTTGLVLTF